MPFALTTGLRALQLLLSIIVLGLAAYAAHWWNQGPRYHVHSPSEVNFMIFTSVWTILSLIYLLTHHYLPEKLGHRFIIFGLEVLTMVFWFAAFIALAVWYSKLLYCVGHICHVIVAADVISALLWPLFVATTVLSALSIFRRRGGIKNIDPVNDDVGHQMSGHGGDV
ncbi:MAG: hypothetical protein M1819_001545 [Sarea resinae]|nr:MAG: hypothetical protein M1819_001545 [Sarea resinae]